MFKVFHILPLFAHSASSFDYSLFGVPRRLSINNFLPEIKQLGTRRQYYIFTNIIQYLSTIFSNCIASLYSYSLPTARDILQDELEVLRTYTSIQDKTGESLWKRTFTNIYANKTTQPRPTEP